MFKPNDRVQGKDEGDDTGVVICSCPRYGDRWHVEFDSDKSGPNCFPCHWRCIAGAALRLIEPPEPEDEIARLKKQEEWLYGLVSRLQDDVRLLLSRQTEREADWKRQVDDLAALIRRWGGMG